MSYLKYWILIRIVEWIFYSIYWMLYSKFKKLFRTTGCYTNYRIYFGHSVVYCEACTMFYFRSVSYLYEAVAEQWG